MEKNLCACGNIIMSGSFACEGCLEDLKYRYLIYQRCDYHNTIGERKEMTLIEWLKNFEENGITDCGECVICGNRYTFMGHNPCPAPTNKEGSCCTKCNDEIVTPLRMKILHGVSA